MILPTAQLNFILTSLAQNHYLSEARLLSPSESSFPKGRDIVAAIVGSVIIANKTVQLCVGVEANFPRSLPLIFLHPPDVFGVLPHLDGDDGYICYMQSEGLLLNAGDPSGILYDALERAIAVLYSGINGENTAGILLG
jgi:hypothetical protein